MGIRLMSGSSHESSIFINPDPYNWFLVRSKQIYNYCVMEVSYRNCTNFEGKKILVIRGVTESESWNYQGNLDPHFTNKNIKWKPIARFEPTNKGWENAIVFCQAIQLGREE